MRPYTLLHRTEYLESDRYGRIEHSCFSGDLAGDVELEADYRVADYRVCGDLSFAVGLHQDHEHESSYLT